MTEKDLRDKLSCEAKDYFNSYFKAIGLVEPYVIAKKSYVKKGSEKRYTRLWNSELTKGAIYIELYDFDFNKIFEKPRKLFRVDYTPDFRKQFSHRQISNSDSYELSIDDMLEVNLLEVRHAEEHMSSTIEFEPDDDDQNINAKTIRDEFCMMHRVPFSNKSWLNKLILKSNKWLQQQQLHQP